MRDVVEADGGVLLCCPTTTQLRTYYSRIVRSIVRQTDIFTSVKLYSRINQVTLVQTTRPVCEHARCQCRTIFTVDDSIFSSINTTAIILVLYFTQDRLTVVHSSHRLAFWSQMRRLSAITHCNSFQGVVWAANKLGCPPGMVITDIQSIGRVNTT